MQLDFTPEQQDVAARGLGLAEGAMMYALDCARQLTYRAAMEVDRGRTGKADAWKLSMAKLSATDLAIQAATDCLQILGGAGYMEEYPMERHCRDAKQLQIVEGTIQIQKNVIGRALLEGDLYW